MEEKSEIKERVVGDLIFEPVSEVEDMEEYKVLNFYPKSNSVKVKDKKSEKILVIGPENTDIENLVE